MRSYLQIGLSLVVAIALAAAIFFYRTKTDGPVSGSDRLQQATAAEILEHVKALNSPLVLVNFWASWCEPCKVEFPHLLTIREKYAERGLKVVFVSLDGLDDAQAALRFLDSMGVDFSTFYKGDQTLKFVNEIYPKWSGAIPMTLLFGTGLSLVDAWEGDASLQEFEERVERHLKGT